MEKPPLFAKEEPKPMCDCPKESLLFNAVGLIKASLIVILGGLSLTGALFMIGLFFGIIFMGFRTAVALFGLVI